VNTASPYDIVKPVDEGEVMVPRRRHAILIIRLQAYSPDLWICHCHENMLLEEDGR